LVGFAVVKYFFLISRYTPISKNDVEAIIFASTRPYQSCLNTITKNKDAQMFKSVDTTVNAPYLIDFSSSLYMSSRRLYITAVAHRYIHHICIGNVIPATLLTKEWKKDTAANKTAETTSVVISTTLIYFERTSRVTLKYLMLTIPDVHKQITNETTLTLV